jgi:hypothetical protein
VTFGSTVRSPSTSWAVTRDSTAWSAARDDFQKGSLVLRFAESDLGTRVTVLLVKSVYVCS